MSWLTDAVKLVVGPHIRAGAVRVLLAVACGVLGAAAQQAGVEAPCGSSWNNPSQPPPAPNMSD